MSRVDPERIRALFIEVCDLDPNARAIALDRACADDRELRAEVESLLVEDSRDDLRESVVDSGAFLRDAAIALTRPLDVGQRIGRYRVVEVLGAGGMGAVYEAEQDEPRRRVAIKVLGVGASPAFMERFRHEAQVLGRLSHPGIAQIFEAGTFELDGASPPYIAMEKVEGVTITQDAERRGLDVRGRIESVARVCDAVEYAHERGVVHRDLKPANILVDATGQPKVLDFGVARVTAKDTMIHSLHTSAGQLVGTLQYMSPEQVSGDPNAVDRRSDVYALGVLLYELLSGKLPYELSNRSIPDAARVIHDVEPTSIAQHVRSLRGDVETIIGRALTKEPARRYPTAAALAADLRRFLRDEPILARPPSTIEQLARFARRHKGLTAGIAIAFLALSVGLVVSITKTREAVRATEESKRQTSRATMSAAASALAAAQPAMARELLASIAVADRGWEWDYVVRGLDQSIARIDAGEDVLASMIDPRGSVVWIARANGSVESWADPFDHAVTACTIPGPLRAAAFSRDAKRLVVQVDGPPATLRIVDPSTGAEVAACPAPCDARASIHADRDVTRVAWVQARGRDAAPSEEGSADPDKNHRFLWVWDVARGVARPIERRPAGMLDDDRIEIAVGSRWLAYGTPFGRSIVVDVDALLESSADDDDWERHRFRQSQVAPRVACADLSADGRVLALGTSSKRIVLRSSVDDEILGQLAQHSGTVTAVTFGADGATLWSGATDQTLREWDVRSGLQRRVWFGHEGAVDDVIPAADGRLLSRSDDGAIRVWSAREELGVLRGHDGEQPYVYAIAFSPDGKRMASGGWDHRVCEWDVASGRPIQVFGDTDAQRMPAVADLAYSSDGHQILAAGAKTIHVCDVETGAVRRVELDSRASCERLAPASNDAAWFVVSNSGRNRPGESRGVSRVDVASGRTQTLFVLEGTRPTCVATSVDGAWVATGCADGRVALWRSSDGELVRSWAEHELPVDSIAFARDGRRLVSAAGDATARVYDVEGDRVVVLADHTARVFCATFSADGRRVATGCEDSVVRLFDADSGELVLELRGHDDYVHDVAFSPDGAVLASGSGDGTVRLWDTRPLRERYLAWRTADARK